MPVSSKANALGNGEFCLVADLCIPEIATRHLHIAEPLEGYRQIVLPSGIAGIGAGQTLHNVEIGLIGDQRVCEIALRHLQNPQGNKMPSTSFSRAM
jgi:hypothetical protein